MGWVLYAHDVHRLSLDAPPPFQGMSWAEMQTGDFTQDLAKADKVAPPRFNPVSPTLTRC